MNAKLNSKWHIFIEDIFMFFVAILDAFWFQNFSKNENKNIAMKINLLCMKSRKIRKALAF